MSWLFKIKKKESSQDLRREPLMPYSNYHVGDSFDGDQIAQIFSAHRDFLIYRAEGSRNVTYYYNDEDPKFQKNISEVSDLIGKLHSCINNRFVQNKFRSMIALAYREILSGNVDAASHNMKGIIAKACPFKRNLAGIFYLISCFFVLVIVSGFSILQDTVFQWNYFDPVIKIMLYGSFGGFISVSISLQKLNIDYDFFNWAQAIYGMFRMLIAILSALIIYVFIKSELILSNLSDNQYLFYSVAVIAGFSETLIPNTLKKLGTQIVNANQEVDNKIDKSDD